MLTVILFVFLSVGVTIIDSSKCACCFPWAVEQCQTPGFPVPCDDCTSEFCAMHVKGCQGQPCQAHCQPDSSSTETTRNPSSSPTTTPVETTYPIGSSTTAATNAGSYIRIDLLPISLIFTVLIFVQSNN